MNIDERRKSIKVVFGIFSLIFLVTTMVLPLCAPSCFAEEPKLSSDPRFEEVRESFEKAQMYMERGRKEFKGRPGLAQKMYEHAEDYFIKAGYLYKKLGHRYEIDTSREIYICDKAYARAHVQWGKAKHRGVRKTF